MIFITGNGNSENIFYHNLRISEVLPMDSKAYKSFIYPLFNLADSFRLKEYQSNIYVLKFVW